MTSSGKTVLVRRILSNWRTLIDISKPTLNVLWCYGAKQELHNIPIKNVNINYINGKPNESLLNSCKPDIIVLDDLMEEIKNDEKMANIFTRESHHKNISVIYIVQNLFNQGKYMRNISLNCHYIVIMKGIRSAQQVSLLGSQLFPGKTKQIKKIFNKATENCYSYLLFDLHPRSNDRFRIRTRITNEECPVNLNKNNSCAPIFFELN
jgi:hypothetical protein